MIENIEEYFRLEHRRNFEGLILLIEEDLQRLLRVNSSKRTEKQKKAINFLKQLEKTAKSEKQNFMLIERLAKL